MTKHNVRLTFANPDVLTAVLDALLYYVEQGAQFIRLDAIAFLWKQQGMTCVHLPQMHLIVQFMRDVLDGVAPGTILITETNVPQQSLRFLIHDNDSKFTLSLDAIFSVGTDKGHPHPLSSIQRQCLRGTLGTDSPLRMPGQAAHP